MKLTTGKARGSNAASILGKLMGGYDGFESNAHRSRGTYIFEDACNKPTQYEGNICAIHVMCGEMVEVEEPLHHSALHVIWPSAEKQGFPKFINRALKKRLRR